MSLNFALEGVTICLIFRGEFDSFLRGEHEGDSLEGRIKEGSRVELIRLRIVER